MTILWRTTLIVTAWLGLALFVIPASGQTECLPGLTVEAFEDGTIDLEWPAVTEAAAYHVQFRGGADNDWFDIEPDFAGTTYSFSPAKFGVAYYFQVIALDRDAESLSTFCPAWAVGDGPDCPAGLTAKHEVNGVHLSWDEVSRADGYNLFRSVDGGQFTFIGHIIGTSAIDSQTEDGGVDITDALRSYFVTATLGEGQSGNCHAVDAVPIPFFPGPIAVAMGGVVTLAVAAGIDWRRRN